MKGKAAFVLLLLVIAAVLSDTFASSYEGNEEVAKPTIVGVGKCFVKCHKGKGDPVCALTPKGKLHIFGRETNSCLRRTCGAGGTIVNNGKKCDQRRAQQMWQEMHHPSAVPNSRAFPRVA